MKRVSAAVLSLTFLFISFPRLAFATLQKNPTTVSVSESLLVTKVYGSDAKVRRVTGTVKLLTVGDRIQKGDRVLTDARSWVELLLGDGSLVRVAPNSEYQFEKMGLAASKRSFQWVFDLEKGGIRAIVEKSDNKQHEVKFKVHTPAAIMGVRGTEFVLRHNPETNTTELYTLSGEVLFGASLQSAESYQAVKKNMTSLIHKGDANASSPRQFSNEDILNLVTSSSASNDSRAEVVSLFLSPEIKKEQSTVKDDVSQFDAKKLLKDLQAASAQFAEAQNYLSGYERLENEKTAAAAEGLMVQKKSVSAPSSAEAKKDLSAAAANQLANQRIQNYTAGLQSEKNIYVSGSTPSDFSDTIKRLQTEIAAAKQNAAVAASCGNRRICNDGFLGTGIMKSCHTAYVCDGAPAQPSSAFPAASTVGEDLSSTMANENSSEVPAATNDSGAGTAPAQTQQQSSTGAGNKRCCEVWVSCFDLRRSENACTKKEKGKVVHVCDERCTSGAGTSFGH